MLRLARRYETRRTIHPKKNRPCRPRQWPIVHESRGDLDSRRADHGVHSQVEMPKSRGRRSRINRPTTLTLRLVLALASFGIVMLVSGFLIWMSGEGEYTILEAVYFSLVTISSVGFGELPHLEGHPYARIVTAITIICGIGAVAVFNSSLTAMFVEGVVGRALRRRRMEKRISTLSNHHVIVGPGRTGRYIVEEFVATERPFVAIDIDEDKLRRLATELGVELIYVVGDAADDQVLSTAGIERAVGLVTALPDDRDNLFVTLSARALNPRLRIVAKVVDAENESKLLRAGADRTVSPQHIGGLRLASELVRPNVTRFLDETLHLSETTRFEEVEIGPESRLIGKTLREVPIRQHARLLVVALHRPDNTYQCNPDPDVPLEAGVRLIVLGESTGTEKLRHIING